MEYWLLIEYEKVEVTPFGSSAPEYLSGEADLVEVVKAEPGATEDQVIRRHKHNAGFYAAVPWKPPIAREYALVPKGA